MVSFNVVDAFKNSIGRVCLFIKNKKNDSESYYDNGADAESTIPSVMKKLRICNIIFIVYGIIAGILIQNYCQYLCRSFAAFAAGMSLSEGGLLSSPLTIVVDVVIIFVCYLMVCVIAFIIYAVLNFVLFRHDRPDDYLDALQAALMYAVFCIVITGIICTALPYNFFVAMAVK